MSVLQYTKNLKSTTGADIFLDEPGILLPASGDLINVDSIPVWRLTSDPAFLFNLLVAGDVVFNNGTIDITDPYLAYDLVRGGAYGSSFLSKPERANDFPSTIINVQEAIEYSRTTSHGKLHQITFDYKRAIKNKWIGVGGTGAPSNESPIIMPWTSKLVGLGFTNKNSGIDTDIEIWVAEEDDGASPITLVYTWDIRDARVARNTLFPTDIVFDRGDKVGVFLRDKGGDPEKVIIILYFQIIDETNEEAVENFSGTFKKTP